MSGSLGFLILPTLDCNLACSYCFSRKKNRYLPKSLIFPLFKKIKEFCDFFEATQLTIYWQGGECLLMGTDWYQAMIEAVQTIFAQNTKLTITQKMQSNIILYQPEWKTILKEVFNGCIGTSLDYPNLYRKVSGDTVAAFETKWIEKRRQMLIDGIKAMPISVINPGSLQAGADEYYDYYTKKLNLKSFQFNFPFTPDRENENYHLDHNELIKFIKRLFEKWWQTGRSQGIHITPFTLFEKSLSDYRNQHLLCIWSKCCASNFFGIDPDGQVSLCNSWVAGYEEFYYGNIFDDPVPAIVSSQRRMDFIQRTNSILDSDCLDCAYCSLCFGGCPMRAYTAGKNIHNKDYYCEVYQEMFQMIDYYLKEKKNSFPVKIP